MSPQSEFYSEEKMEQLYPEAFKAREDTSRTLREYTIKIMEEYKTGGDPDNPRNFLEHFMLKR